MAAGKLNTLLQLAVVVILITLLCGFSSVWSQQYLKVHVYVNNNLYPGTDMWVHCKSEDEDLGAHKVAYDMDFAWTSHIKIDWDTTKFVCHIWWWDSKGQMVDGFFDIYKSTRDIYDCTYECHRFVKPDGIYFLVNDTIKFTNPWPE
ncbi:Plant self-incompatibility S1 [Macleaya cordata]|uniref:S-protein homolog n=1 Tax=Macleaya cordata TaxID=56857 RepID=A0A200QS48_MACCD|nr:Plant self-incompatibility S1 [Macleaya cordata]